MRNDQSHKIYRRLVIFGLISLAIIAISYLLIVYWGFPGFTRSVSEIKNWEMFDVFTGVISLSLLAGGFTFALAEYIDSEKAKQAEKAKLSYDIYKAIFEKLTDPEQEAARRWILSNISIKEDDEDIAAWYEKTHKKITAGGKRARQVCPRGKKRSN